MQHYQSVTSRLKTSRYRDFSQFFEIIGLGLENFGLEKSLGIGLDEIFWSRHSVLCTHREDLGVLSQGTLALSLI